MSGVFRNIEPPPPHGPSSVYPPPLVWGEDTLVGWRGGGGSIVRKTPDTALFSIYVSTLGGGGGLDVRTALECSIKPSYGIRYHNYTVQQITQPLRSTSMCESTEHWLKDVHCTVQRHFVKYIVGAP